MRRITERIVIVSILALLLFASACALKSVRKESETTPKGSETIAATPTARATVTPNPTRKPTPTPKPTATPKPTLTPTPEPVETPEMISLEDYTSEKAFLMADIAALDEDNRSLQLKAGQIIWLYRKDDGGIDETSRFFLPTEKQLIREFPGDSMPADCEVFFRVSEGKYGEVCFGGIPEHLLFGTERSLSWENMRTVEIDPWVHQRGISDDIRYVMNIDWNRDGIKDEVWIKTYQSYPFQLVVFFRDGKDGLSVRKEIMLHVEDDEEECLSDWIESDNLLLLQKPNGDYVIMISGVMSIVSSYGDCAKTGALMFDPEQGFAGQILDNIFEYKNDVLYSCGIDGFFGNCYCTTRHAVRLNNDLSCERLSDTIYFVNEYDNDLYVLQDIRVEVEGLSSYSSSVLVPGIAVFPEKAEAISSGKKWEYMLYFVLVDGQRFRIRVGYNEDEYDYFTAFEDEPLGAFFPMHIGG